MCLAIPGKVLTVENETQPVMGNVSFAGIQRRVCLEWLPDVKVGEYVLVHVGFALSKVDEKEAEETLDILKQMGDLDELKVDEGGGEIPNLKLNSKSQAPSSKEYSKE